MRLQRRLRLLLLNKSLSKYGNRPLLIAGLISALVLAVWLFLRLRQPETPEYVAKKGLEALMRWDADTIYGYLGDDEVEKLKLTRDKFAKFLKDFVRPRLVGFKPVGAPKLTSYPDTRGAADVQILRHPDGRQVWLTINAYEAGRRDARIGTIVADLLAALDGTELVPGQVMPHGSQKLNFWAAVAQRDRSQLEGMGIDGFLRADGQYFSWDDWIDHCLHPPGSMQ